MILDLLAVALVVLVVVLCIMGYQKYQEVQNMPMATRPDPGQFQLYLSSEEDGTEMIVFEFREGRTGRTRPLAEGVYETLDTTGEYVKKLEIRKERFLPWLQEEGFYLMPVLLSRPVESKRRRPPEDRPSRQFKTG